MPNSEDLTTLSKFLSYLLRHHPEEIGLNLDRNGWAQVEELIKKANKHGKHLSRDTLEKVIQHGSKKRFILSEDGAYIRAGYGHSINVDLDLEPTSPPDKLYHGTAEKNVPSIMTEGIHAGNRKFVHLSADRADARSVGSRHGSPFILLVEAKDMAKQGHEFYQSESEPGIWLTKKVPPEFIEQS